MPSQQQPRRRRHSMAQANPAANKSMVYVPLINEGEITTLSPD